MVLLLNAGAKVDFTLSDNSTPLMVAVAKNLVEIARLLVEFGVSIVTQNKVRIRGD